MHGRAILLTLLMVTMSLSGCFGEDEIIEEPEVIIEESPRVFVTDKTGNSVDIQPIEMTFHFSDTPRVIFLPWDHLKAGGRKGVRPLLYESW